MDLARAVYSAVAEVRDGGVNEIEVRHDRHDETTGFTESLTVVVRRWSAAEAYAILHGTDFDDDDDPDPAS